MINNGYHKLKTITFTRIFKIQENRHALDKRKKSNEKRKYKTE